jgi:hypothetical protein
MSIVTDNKPQEPVVPNKSSVPKPIKPWKATPKQLLPDFLGALGAVIGTLIVVAFSPMAGILGFVLTFIIISVCKLGINYGYLFPCSLCITSRGFYNL